jgi:hypothetical protein
MNGSQELLFIDSCKNRHAFHSECHQRALCFGEDEFCYVGCCYCIEMRRNGDNEMRIADEEMIEEHNQRVREDMEREEEIQRNDDALEETWAQYYRTSGQEDHVAGILSNLGIQEEEEVEERNIELVEEDDGFIPFLQEDQEEDVQEESIYGVIAIREHKVLLCTPISTDVFGDCPVCYELMVAADLTITRCGHIFHASCMFDAINRKKNCPLCRTVLSF